MNTPSNPEQKRKPGRPKLEQSQTKMMILRTGAYLFMEVGYEKVSLASVAKACDITKASLYYYFKNKAELFTACIISVLGFALKGTINILAEDISLKEKLKKIAVKQMSNDHLDFESMMRDASVDLSEEQVQKIRDAEKSLHDLMTDAFEKSIAAGEITAKHQPYMLAHTFVALLMMKNHLNLKQQNLPLEQLVDEMIEIVWFGIQNEGESPLSS